MTGKNLPRLYSTFCMY